MLLAGLSFPFVHAVKLGQVGPLLFLALRHRLALAWMPRRRLGLSAAVGSRGQGATRARCSSGPLLTRRFGGAVVIGGAAVALAVVATIVTGPIVLARLPDVLPGTVTDPITTPRNLTPGAIAYQLGASASVAAARSSWPARVAVVAARPGGDPARPRTRLRT